jgi:hypothetical protein
LALFGIIPDLNDAIAFFGNIWSNAPTPLKIAIFIAVGTIFFAIIQSLALFFHIDTVIMKPPECATAQQQLLNYSYPLTNLSISDMDFFTECLNEFNNNSCYCIHIPINSTQIDLQGLRFDWEVVCVNTQDVPAILIDPTYLALHPELLSACQYTAINLADYNITPSYITTPISYCYQGFAKEGVGSPTQQEYQTLLNCQNEGFDLLVIINPVSFSGFSLLFFLSAFAIDWYAKLGIF